MNAQPVGTPSVVSLETRIGGGSVLKPASELANLDDARTRPAGLRVCLCTAGEIWGGVELAVLLLARGLAAQGLTTSAILFHEGPLAERLRTLGIPITVVRAGHPYDPRQVRRVGEALREHDVQLLHTHGYKGTVWGALAARRLRIPVIKTAHGRVEKPGALHDVGGWIRLLAFNQLEALITRAWVRQTVAVSRDLRAHLPATRRSGVAQIYNGIPPVRPPVRDRRPDFHLGIVGRLTPVKGHAVLLQALRHLDDRRVMVHVFGTGPLEQECRTLAERLGVQPQVHFHGFCPEMEPHFSSLDVLVMPSFSEGLPFSLLEAMAHGLPVIASAVGGVPEVIEHGVSGLLVPPNDPVRLAKGIALLRDDRDLASRMGLAAVERIGERFTADEMVRAHAALYARVVRERS